MKRSIYLSFMVFVSGLMNLANAQSNTGTEQSEKVKLLTEAYLYGYPVLTMAETFRSVTNTELPDPIKGKSPVNQAATLYPFPKAGFTAVVRPNLDTYYNMVYANLENGPLYIHLPATKRYYLIPILNAYGDVVQSLGSRTTGQDDLDIVLVGPDFNGELPKDLLVIRSNTNLNWMLGRVQVDNDKDGKSEVKNFYNEMIVRPLAERGNSKYKAPKGTYKPANEVVPMKAVDDLEITAFYNKMMELLLTNPPQEADKAFIEKLAEVGITPGGNFDITAFTSEEQKAIKAIPSNVQKLFAHLTAHPDKNLVQNGWFVVTKGLGEYGTNYALRAYVTKIGFGANTAEDAIYPNAAIDVEGNKFNGSNQYILHFDADKLPPVKGFWSITMYNKEGFLVDNTIDRYNLSNKKELQYNEDGSLDIYIQATAPEGMESNWLPSTTAGVEFELTFRMYWPSEAILNRTWVMPGVKKVN
ncbi:DUF1254 domain-containing protein [Flammeovirga agarivorans]|uniref:DUF1254 domain-containing protein n=1 Tax=Flammeovirga agarivorans TaxID=2726742 RepID=A0A7X8SQ88_9BACT|nr:DUF1214 domain-containing protein [Flammeovirga agarivorans]NLR94408.1 DUF1254 domain-containing protein [Flammeovirga agarivorans]